ncbi:PP2C family protein-serine/threonine phosphatase [Micromonospora zhanjiangensis]|uniref:PP2C family protein-serine/threonine phosphatase n=1 Tax=Micromonospora zhanjiangensis TaxID=1522057 RepID=A0ABV8KVU2_9ACTN
MTAPSCPEHGPPPDAGDSFCEVCGRNLRTGAAPTLTAAPLPGPSGGAAPVVPWLSSRAGDGACAGCGGPVPAGAYCDRCGRRRGTGRDRSELELDGLAAVTDRANRRRNEDAVAIGRTATARVAVVCDGVSTSARADTAAQAAAEAAVATLLTALTAGADPAEASRRAARAATTAAREVAVAEDRDSPPSCTYVSAVVTGEQVTVGWIGDSRAYWLGREPAQLTVDDSVRALLAAGRPLPAGLAGVDERSASLVRWLGSDGDGAEAQLVTVRPTGPGLVLVCSDGLHHYLPSAADLADAVTGLSAGLPGARGGPAGRPLDLARGLTALAVRAGGHDNIAVAVLPYAATGTAEGGTML